jgi:hypothetical protein
MAEKPRPFTSNRPSPESNPNIEQEISLSDLLPDLLADTPPPVTAEPAPPPPAQVAPIFPDLPATPELVEALLAQENAPAEENTSRFGNIRGMILTFVALIVTPLVLIGLFLFIVNTFFSLSSTMDQESLIKNARTPIATVYSVTPVPTPRPGQNPNCPKVSAFGPFDSFNCAREIAVSVDFTNFLSLADAQLNQEGHRSVGTQRRYEAVSAKPDEILQFYATSLKAKGYIAAAPEASGTTSLGAYRVIYYGNGKQQAQLVVISLSKADPQGTVKAGESLIRISFT